MRIIRHPYQAIIAPQAVRDGALWHWFIRCDGSAEVLVRHDAVSKEDACCMALLEISRLKQSASPPNPPLRNAKLKCPQ